MQRIVNDVNMPELPHPMRDTLAPVLNKRDAVAAYLVKASDPNISKQVEVDRDSVDASTTSGLQLTIISSVA